MNEAKPVILVVDDVPDTLTLASSLLSPQYKVKVATSGEANFRSSAWRDRKSVV